MSAVLKLDEYRSTRAALVNAGINMTGSIDAPYSDWRRWRDKSKLLSTDKSVDAANLDRW
jgi:hypothetical protein